MSLVTAKSSSLGLSVFSINKKQIVTEAVNTTIDTTVNDCFFGKSSQGISASSSGLVFSTAGLYSIYLDVFIVSNIAISGLAAGPNSLARIAFCKNTDILARNQLQAISGVYQPPISDIIVTEEWRQFYASETDIPAAPGAATDDVRAYSRLNNLVTDSLNNRSGRLRMDLGEINLSPADQFCIRYFLFSSGNSSALARLRFQIDGHVYIERVL